MTSPSPLLQSLMIQIQPLESGAAPLNTGSAVRAWFLRLIQTWNPAVSQRWHDHPAYTLSDVMGFDTTTPDGQRRLLSPEQSGWLRITTLDAYGQASLSEQLLSMLDDGLVRHDSDDLRLRLGGVKMAIQGVFTAPDNVPWAAENHPRQLVDFGKRRRDLRELTLLFNSPTSFKAEGRNDDFPKKATFSLPFPYPANVFWSLAQKWREFVPESESGLSFDPVKLRRFADARIAVSGFSLDGQDVAFGDQRKEETVGCVGTCTVRLLGREEEWNAIVRALAAFALYAGVGARATTGRGQAALVASPDDLLPLRFDR